jgi:hypothetical protein
MFAAACALLALAAAPQAVGAGLKPQAPPQTHRNAPQPVAWPGASSTKSSPSTSSLSPALRRTVRSAVIVRSASATPQRRAPRSKAQPPAQDRGRPIGFRDAAGLNELRSVASSGGSALLLAAGLALLLLVIGETTFLGLASSRLGAPEPVKRRPPEEPYPIRRVQLRR